MFNKLKQENIREIVDIELNALHDKSAESGYEIIFSDSLISELCVKGYDDKFGARPLNRTIQAMVEDVITDYIIEKELPVGSKIHIDYVDGAPFCESMTKVQDLLAAPVINTEK